MPSSQSPSFHSQTSIILDESRRIVSVRHLTSSLENCKSLADLRQLARDHKTELNAIHDSVICVVACRLGSDLEKDDEGCPHSQSEAIAIYSLALRNWLNRQYGSKGRDEHSCTYILRAGAKLRINVNTSLYTDLCDVAKMMAKDFNSQHLTTCLWSVAKLGAGSTSKPLVDALISQCIEKINDIEPMNVSIFMWSVATLGTDVTGEAVIPLLVSRCLQVAKDFNAKEVSFCLRFVAIIGLRLTGVEIVSVLVSRCKESISELTSQGVSNCLWSVATIGVKFTGEAIVSVLMTRCIDLADKLTSQGVATCLWSVATLGVKITREAVVTVLMSRCIEMANEFNSLEIANCLWSMATLHISNKDAIRNLFRVFTRRAGEMTPSSVSNCSWAIASIVGEDVVDEVVINALLKVCLENSSLFKTSESALVLSALANLRISDHVLVQKISRACIFHVEELNTRQVAVCLLAVATFGIEIIGTDVLPIIFNACVYRCREFNDQDIATCFWSLASLYDLYKVNEQYKDLSSALVLAVETRFPSMTRLDQANQCLQAHYIGLTLSENALKHFNAIFHKATQNTSTTASQEAVAAALTHLGYSIKQEVPIFSGVVTVDIVIQRSLVPNGAAASSMPVSKDIAIEFDGPKHFMRRAFGSKDRVGPIDVRSRLRNSLIKKSGRFEALVVIPFYEWDESVTSHIQNRGSSDDGSEDGSDGIREHVLAAKTSGIKYLADKLSGIIEIEGQ